MPPEPIEIFRAGRHQAMSGETLAFSEQDLAASAAAYDPALHEAPLVVGHPEHDKPAYGWVGKLSFADGALTAEPAQVDPAFVELVQAGRFKKISAAFYRPDAPTNPKPGVYYLRHVGFLGAQPPAVKGLKQVQFADSAEEVIVFGDWNDRAVIRLFRNMRDLLISHFGADEAEKTLPQDTLNALGDDAAQPNTTTDEDDMTTSPNFAEQQAALERRQKELEEREAAFKRESEAFAERDRAQRRVGHVNFVDGLVTAGKVIPAHKTHLLAFMDRLEGADAITFGEGDKQTTKPAIESFKEFLSSLPKQVTFSEVAAAEGVRAEPQTPAPQGYTVDPEREELHRRALAYQEKNKGVDYITAVKAVSAAA